jgi:hypothetical protein
MLFYPECYNFTLAGGSVQQVNVTCIPPMKPLDFGDSDEVVHSDGMAEDM